MESILDGISEAPITPSARRRAYELILKIVKNIIKAASDEDPHLGKYKWIKAQSGSALRENVIGISPLFRELLEALGFTFRVGRPPHVRTGAPQEYVVLRDDANFEDLASKAQILEAVLHSISDEVQKPSEREARAPSPPAQGSQPSETGETAPCEAVACSVSSRLPRSPHAASLAQRSDSQGAELEALRREQQERYRRRAEGGEATRPPSGGPNGTPDSGQEDSGNNWFWRKFGWGGNNNNNDDDRNSDGRSTSSRRPPLNNRMMTLRDLPKPQRRG